MKSNHVSSPHTYSQTFFKKPQILQEECRLFSNVPHHEVKQRVEKAVPDLKKPYVEKSGNGYLVYGDAGLRAGIGYFENNWPEDEHWDDPDWVNSLRPIDKYGREIPR